MKGERYTSQEKANTRRYLMEIGLASVAYVLATLAAGFIVRRMDPEDPLRIAVALIPVLPAFGMLLAVVRHVLRSDELEQRIHSDGAMISAVTMMIVSITYGFLESYAGFPPFNPIWLAMIGILAWSAGAALTKRRYL